MQPMRDVLRTGLGRALREWAPLDRLVAAWPVAAGPVLAAHGTLAGLDDGGTLSIQVDDAVWLARMLPLRETLASELSRAAGVRVREIHFRETARERVRKPPAASPGRPGAARPSPQNSKRKGPRP